MTEPLSAATRPRSPRPAARTFDAAPDRLRGRWPATDQLTGPATRRAPGGRADADGIAAAEVDQRPTQRTQPDIIDVDLIDAAQQDVAMERLATFAERTTAINAQFTDPSTGEPASTNPWSPSTHYGAPDTQHPFIPFPAPTSRLRRRRQRRQQPDVFNAGGRRAHARRLVFRFPPSQHPVEHSRGRGGLGGPPAWDTTGAEGIAAGFRGQPHGLCHQHGIGGPGDGRGHQHRVATQFHGLDDVTRPTDAGAHRKHCPDHRRRIWHRARTGAGAAPQGATRSSSPAVDCPCSRR